MTPRSTVVQLGCCHEEIRCRLCTAAPDAVDADYVRVAREEAGGAVRFFGGPPPTAALLAAAGPGAIIRVRPDLLDREHAELFADHGVAGIELDALTFDNATLRLARRDYSQDRLLAMAEGLRDFDFELGIVLSVGLPGSSHELCMQDAALAAPLFDTARLHPVLVLRETGLWRLHLDEFYVPLTLAQAVHTCRSMVDVLEAAQVKVIRVGQQPGPDELGRCVAGPLHSGFRELVEAERTLDHLRSLLQGTNGGKMVVIRCATADETRTRGPLNANVRTLRAEFGLSELEVRADPGLERGAFVLEAS